MSKKTQQEHLEDLLVVMHGLKMKIEMLEHKKGTLFNSIKHGDQKHKDWLKKAIEDHFADRLVERP